MDKTSAQPFFSVVVPLYNKRDYIGRCLQSVLTQKFSNFEVVIVDDGSTDDGAGVVSSCQDARIHLVRQANAGVGAARNKGMDLARGQWIAFLDADDEYMPDFLKEVHLCISQYPFVGAVFAKSQIDGGNDGDRPKIPSMNVVRIIDDYDAFLMADEEDPINSSCVAVRREVFNQTGLFPQGVKVGEDTDMWMRIGWTTKIAYINKCLSIYHLTAGTSGWQTCREFPHWVLTCQQWILENKIPHHLLKSARTRRSWAYLMHALGHGVRGNIPEGRKLFSEGWSLRYSPKQLLFKTFVCLYFPNVYRGVRYMGKSFKNILTRRLERSN